MRRTIIFSAILIAVCALLSCKGGYSDGSSDNDDDGGGAGGDSGKAITAFSFTSAKNPGLSADVSGIISGASIAATVPYGTAVTSLVATFTTTGASVSVGSAAQTSKTTANDFSSAKTYTVTAADGSTQDYTVTVTVAAASAKAITAFSFPAVSWAGIPTSLASSFGTTISGTSITVKIPYGSTAMVASFATTGATVKVGSAVQVSGVTSNDFKDPVTYRVTAADGSTQDYTVTMLFAPGVNSAENGYQGGVLSSYWKVYSTATYDVDSIGLYLTCDAINAGSDDYSATIQLGTTGEVYGAHLSPSNLQAKSSIATVTQSDYYITIVGPMSEIKKLLSYLEFIPPQPIYPATVHNTACEVDIVVILTDKNGLKAGGWINYNIQPM